MSKSKLTKLCAELGIPENKYSPNLDCDSQEVQNFVRYFSDDASNLFFDLVYAPCIMLICNSKSGFDYCHFDESNLNELTGFIDFAHENGNIKIGLFGGIGSENIPKLIQYTTRKKIQILAQKDFVDFFPLRRIAILDNLFYFFGDSPKRKEYPFSELHSLLR